MQPKSRLILGAVDQDLDRGIMSRALQIDHDYDKAEKIKKANEMETYWLCCCDAAKYNFSEAAILKIKAVNNKNLMFGGYEILANPKQQEILGEINAISYFNSPYLDRKSYRCAYTAE